MVPVPAKCNSVPSPSKSHSSDRRQVSLNQHLLDKGTCILISISQPHRRRQPRHASIRLGRQRPPSVHDPARTPQRTHSNPRRRRNHHPSTNLRRLILLTDQHRRNSRRNRRRRRRACPPPPPNLAVPPSPAPAAIPLHRPVPLPPPPAAEHPTRRNVRRSRHGRSPRERSTILQPRLTPPPSSREHKHDSFPWHCNGWFR
jgi:hypothetical protein